MLYSSIDQLIKNEDFYHFNQNLFNVSDWKIMGNEILLRSEIGTPDVVFQEAKTANKLFELETRSIFKILQTYTLHDHTLKGLLFINIFPSTILHIEFPNFIKKLFQKFSSIRQYIVFEILETDFIENISTLKERVKHLKNLGYLIAIDDVGKGWSSLNMIIELEPHFIKLDQYFSINLSELHLKQEMIRSVLHYAHYSNSKVVLEGVERGIDLEVAKRLGVDICQGYLLHKPEPICTY